jgi:hypothetical protein
MRYILFGSYNGGRSEIIDEADSKKEALHLLSEYKVAFGPSWSLWLVKR